MSTRVIKLKLLTQQDLVIVETSARLRGELREEPKIKALGIDWNSVKLIDRATKASFDLDEAVLPATDCLLFVTPTKTKSGAEIPYKEVKNLIKEYKSNGGEVPFNYTQATTAQLNTFWNSVKNHSANTSTKPSVEKIDKVVEETKAAQANMPLVDIAEVITKSQLNDEAKYLRSKF